MSGLVLIGSLVIYTFTQNNNTIHEEIETSVMPPADCGHGGGFFLYRLAFYPRRGRQSCT